MLKINDVLELLYEGYEVQYDVTKVGLFHWVRGRNNKLHQIHYNTFHCLKMQGFIEQDTKSHDAKEILLVITVWKITDKGREAHEWRNRNKSR